MSPKGKRRLSTVEAPVEGGAGPATTSAHEAAGPSDRDAATTQLGIVLATCELRVAARELDDLLTSPSLTGSQAFHLLQAAQSTHRALLALDEIRLPLTPPERPHLAAVTSPRPGEPPAPAPQPVPTASRVDLEVVQALINRISWIALVLTPLTSASTDPAGEIRTTVADLDGLIRDLRSASAAAEEPGEDPVDQARQVLHDVQARLSACWTERFEARSDPVHTDLLAEASHLVRSALIALQRGAVP